MKQTVNKIYKPLFTNKLRYVILMGGRGAGRSTVASQYALAKLQSDEYFRCAIMRLVLGDIRNSIYREITDRAEENGVKDAVNINESQMVLTYGKNSINAVGFKKSSGDQKAKLKSLANYTTVIVEEADEIGEEDFIQLDDSLRTLKGNVTIILLLNPPPKSHWIIKRWFNLNPVEGIKNFYTPVLKPEMTDTLFIQASYKDNEKNIAQASIDNYERYQQTRPDHYFNMIKGFIPETVKGKIYKDWQEIDSVPHGARLVRRWLDFGYSNDPSACGDIWYWNGGYILDEQFYRTGMTNPMIASQINLLEDTITIADSSEPKSIEELRQAGVNIMPAVKGAGSITHGIQAVQSVPIWYTKRSTNIKKEYDNYAWFVTKDGETLNEPKDIFNHHMDGIRYGIQSLVGDSVEEESEEEFGLYKGKYK